MQRLFTSIRVFITLLVFLGVVYPLLITGIGQMVMPYEANGSLIEKEGMIVGSELIGQKFTTAKYFHGRPSYVDYNASYSGASNLSPTNKKLIEIVKARVQKIKEENSLLQDTLIPADMVLASASGLDPHISLENAILQETRVAHNRGMTIAKVEKLIIENVDADFVGIWGKPGVNVLKLNLMLDELSGK